jgi:ABC-2 type transport system ATP-binding protein
MEGTPLLTLERLGKDFGTTAALKELSFSLYGGEVVCLLGPNGAGKTTTMRLMLGLLRPTRGRATAFDLDCTADAERVKASLGYTQDEPVFYDFLTGRETLDFVLNVRKTERAPLTAWIDELVTALDFRTEMAATTGSYSLGMRKKLALLLAMAHRPRLLLLDEPTNGLDPPTAAAVRDILRKYAEGGGAVLVATHLLDMADRLADRILIMNHGALVTSGTGADIRAAAGAAPNAPLEDAFMRLVGRAAPAP